MSGTLYNFITNTGVIVPDSGSLLGVVQTEWTDALGASLNVTQLSTPQGIQISAEVAARSAVANNNAALANQINPNQAGGIFLDALCALTGLERVADTNTTVENVALGGVPNTPIAQGSEALTPNEDSFTLVAAVTLDATGAGIGTFAAVAEGPIAAPSGAWTPTGGVLGWETANNPSVGIPGSVAQSDESLRALRRATLAKQGRSNLEAITGNVADVQGVIGVQGLENIEGTVTVDQGVTLQPHSFWIVADGGSDTAVATAMLGSKSGGAGWNGAVAVPIDEPISGQSYTVNFDRPTVVPLLAQIQVKQGLFPGDAIAATEQAVLDYSNNEIAGITGFVVGQSASPFEIAGAIMQECPGIYVKVVNLSLTGTVAFAPAEIPMLIFQKAQLTSGHITVTVAT